MCRIRLIREAGFIKRLIEKVARSVAGKDPASPVSTVSSRRQTQDQQFCVRVAKTGDRLAPILPAEERPPLLKRNFLAIADKSRALAAMNNGLV